jgi:hypothetical protein
LRHGFRLSRPWQAAKSSKADAQKRGWVIALTISCATAKRRCGRVAERDHLAARSKISEGILCPI